MFLAFTSQYKAYCATYCSLCYAVVKQHIITTAISYLLIMHHYSKLQLLILRCLMLYYLILLFLMLHCLMLNYFKIALFDVPLFSRCTIQCWTIWCSTIWCYTIYCCTNWRCTVLILCYLVLHYSMLHYFNALLFAVTVGFVVLVVATLYYIALLKYWNIGERTGGG